MQSSQIIVKCKSTANQQSSFVMFYDINSNLSELRSKIIKQKKSGENFFFLKKDKTILNKFAENTTPLQAILDQSNTFYIQQDKDVAGVNDANIQMLHNSTISIYEELEHKMNVLRAKLLQFYDQFNERINGLPKINANYQGQVNHLGNYQGIGKYTYHNGQVHIGHFKNGKRHGLGCYKFLSGDTYEGEYINNVADGIGIQTFTNGNSMVAVYKNNSSNGLGIYFYSNGEKLLGKFVQNHFEGIGIKISPDGSQKLMNYSSGYLSQDQNQ